VGYLAGPDAAGAKSPTVSRRDDKYSKYSTYSAASSLTRTTVRIFRGEIRGTPFFSGDYASA
jgi:hypothetical protein